MLKKYCGDVTTWTYALPPMSPLVTILGYPLPLPRWRPFWTTSFFKYPPNGAYISQAQSTNWGSGQVSIFNTLWYLDKTAW